MSDKKSGFSQPPIKQIDKQKLAEKIIKDGIPKNEIEAVKKVSIILRIPESLADDITTIKKLTGMTRNSVCIELLKNATKIKLKQLLEEKEE
jgi:di/tricarboxylate transporter